MIRTEARVRSGASNLSKQTGNATACALEVISMLEQSRAEVGDG